MLRIEYGCWSLVAWIALAVTAFAQPTGVYAVKDVAPNDVLNVRSGAGASFQDIGDVAFDGRVHVIGFNESGSWAEVMWETGTAWVSMRFLQPVHLDGVERTNAIPAGLQCGGTEPFWSADFGAGTISFDMMGGSKSSAPVEWAVPARGRPADYILGFAAGPFTGVLMKQTCSDGMSDNTYPWSVVLINRSSDGPKVVEGCCSQ